ncbi:uncharacterized protein H6S33_010988 [Morchella sextelata]|uniref:uncharacterized protein n=1 Tax=Morchella sextelata TaxID=1174677 RepID=UPI001D05946F|nr:uncharacterized protein H6S33_010988 [Morchella sextelata]KAH0611723.1 hypothetical protein H6S33_010988 [Morchella sextelata]
MSGSGSFRRLLSRSPRSPATNTPLPDPTEADLERLAARNEALAAHQAAVIVITHMQQQYEMVEESYHTRLRVHEDSDPPSDTPIDDPCTICDRRTACVQFVQCSHRVCKTCTKREYWAGMQRLRCPFCRVNVLHLRDVRNNAVEGLQAWMFHYSPVYRARGGRP